LPANRMTAAQTIEGSKSQVNSRLTAVIAKVRTRVVE
jgi:hypothetical protein